MFYLKMAMVSEVFFGKPGHSFARTSDFSEITIISEK